MSTPMQLDPRTVQSCTILRSVENIPTSEGNDESCLICLSSYKEMRSDNKPLILTKCNKYLHMECIKQWIEDPATGAADLKHQSCPGCRGQYLEEIRLNIEPVKLDENLSIVKKIWAIAQRTMTSLYSEPAGDPPRYKPKAKA